MTDNGADIISMSISGSSGSTTLLNAVQYATSRGVVVITSAGNTGDTAQRYPVVYSGVIAVRGSDSADGRYSWSTYGDWVDVAAPGAVPRRCVAAATARFAAPLPPRPRRLALRRCWPAFRARQSRPSRLHFWTRLFRSATSRVGGSTLRQP